METPMTSESASAKRRRPATIVDVAQLAGVAVGTVSRHLNGLPVRTSNRAQIEKAIAALGYRRNTTAVAMKTDHTHIVGLMMPSMSEFHAAVLEQLTRRMRLTGQAVLSFCHDLEPLSILEGLEFFASRRVDAIVVDGQEVMREALMKFIDNGIACILYDNDIPGLPLDRVFVDNRKSSARVVSHLLDLGHRRIALLHGDFRDSAARERSAGFHDAFTAHGLTPDPELIVNGHWKEMGGYNAIRQLLSLQNPPTAVFSSNYNMTFGALTYLHADGVVLPRDLSLVGFDDVPALQLHQPGITAVGQPIEKIAKAITDIIDTRRRNPADLGRQEMTIKCDLVLRESAAPLR
jgi:LacI family transcriptional regulator